MTNSDSKQKFITYITDSTGFPTDDVYSLMYGRVPARYGQQHIRLIQALAKDGQGIIVGVVWKGEPDPKHLRNSPVYFYLGQLIQSVNLRLHNYGYTSQLFFSNQLLADEPYFEQMIADHPNAGLINFAYMSADIQQIYNRLNRPIVYIDYPSELDVTNKYVIALDNLAVFEQAVIHLYDLGHRRIAFIKSPQHKHSFVARYEGYLNGLKQVGLSMDESLVFAGNWYEASGEAAARAFLALSSPPTAIIASNDLMAFGAMKVIKAMGLSIPGDISIIGFDDIASAVDQSPPLTSVSTPITEMGSKAAKYIISLLEGKFPMPEQVYLPVKIIHRDSTGAAPEN